MARPLSPSLAAAAVLAGCLLAPAAEAAVPRMQSTLRFTETAPGVSAGLHGSIRNGSVARPPAPARQLTIGLPVGAQINLGRSHQCTADRAARIERGHAAVCPPQTRMGTATATVLVEGEARLLRLELWNVKADGVDHINVEQTFEGRRLPPFSASVQGRSFVVPLAGARVVRLTLSIPAVGGEEEWNRVFGPLIALPERCPRTASRRFTITAAMTGTDGRRRVARSRSRCG